MILMLYIPIISMRVLVIGGNSISNKSWCQDLCNKLVQVGEQADYISYNHRDSEEKKILDFDVECKKLVEIIKYIDEPYSIISKSAGNLIVLSQLHTFEKLPTSLVICGLPLRFAENMNIQYEFKDEQFPVKIIQNEFDPEGSSEEVKEKVPQSKTREIITILGDNTHYYAPETIINIVYK